MRENLFAIDCGSTNWRLYRVSYEVERQAVRMIGEPQASPLTSFIERRLPTVLLLNPSGDKLDSFGEAAYQYLYDEKLRAHIREFFKPSIGAHLERRPLPYQTRYSHEEAMLYTKLLLQAVLEQLRVEKWRSRPFDESLRFAFTYPVHWRESHNGQILEGFKDLVLHCFPASFDSQIDFVSEPEAAILSLRHQEVLDRSGGVVLLLDCGGSTTDLTAGRLTAQGELQVLQRYGEPHGGGLYDEAIADYIAEALKIPATDLARDPTSKHLLRMFARQLKEALSRQQLTPTSMRHAPQRAITIVTQQGQVYRKTLSLDEATFRRITQPLQADFTALLDSAMRAMRLSENEITQVALVGGSAQLFTVVQTIRERFGPDKVILADNPSEAVAHGLALEYGYAFGTAKPWLSQPDPSINRITSSTPVQPKSGAETPLLLPANEDDSRATIVEAPPQQPNNYRLISDNGQHYPLTAPVITLGRKRTNQVVVYDDQASRLHAKIEVQAEGCQITDMNSSNGTYLNENRLAPHRPHPLQPQDQIRIGRTVFTFLI